VAFGQNVLIVLSAWSVTAVSFEQNVPLCYPPTALLHPCSIIRTKVPLYFRYTVITLPIELFGQEIN